MRNFTKSETYNPKKIVLENEIFSKENDNIKIVFTDEDRTDITQFIHVDENSHFSPLPLGFIGVQNDYKNT